MTVSKPSYWEVTLFEKIYTISEEVLENEIKKLIILTYILRTGSKLSPDILMKSTKVKKLVEV